jgi:hypothetical protein
MLLGCSSTRTTGQNGGNNPDSCSISVYERVLNESSSADQQQTSSWTIRHVNTWTIFTPNSRWILQASSAGGMDAGLNGSDASVGNLYAGPGGGPWTTASIFSHELSAVSDTKVVCSTSVESDSSGSNQAEEFTGTYQGDAIHGMLVASVLAPYGYGEIRSFFTPASQWSTANVTMLSLILKRAIPSPGSLNQ